ncbi:MAG: Protein involved in biosynthesis of mitomycin antibiotics/polyketide fumonisin [Bacilli bacterium]|nr:Protein involved in biosynthesis of mitomycin antibiotics/polyketide fumonisin [Bacilli bacterium]
MELNHLQKETFRENGFVQIKGCVPQVMVNQALRAINHSVGEGMSIEQMTTFRAQSFCPELTHSRVITDLLLKTPAWEFAESLLGEDQIRPVTGGQIALRFPSLQDPPNPPTPHLDGMYTPTNGVPEGTIQNFTMLVGVLLSDLSESFAGNFTVWPGSHLLYQNYFQAHGPESLLAGMPPVELPEPLQITGKAGDVILCHYQLGHAVAANVSPFTRYAIFYRLTHINYQRSSWQEPMRDIWLHLPGMRDFKLSSLN